MSIVCATDFSEPASRAASAAASLAARLGEPLELVNVVEVAGEPIYASAAQAVTDAATVALEAEATRLRRLGAEVRIALVAGAPHEELAELARAKEAQLVVVGSSGRGRAGEGLGGRAERLARSCPAPLLVVRAPEVLEEWLAGARPLRIVIGVGFDAASDAALRWVGKLRAAGPCEVTAVHLYWPPRAYGRVGLGGPRDLVEVHPEIERVLSRELEALVQRLGVGGAVRSRVGIELGDVASALLSAAEQEGADLLVLGAHRRAGLERLWHRSVTHGALRMAPVSVAIVPAERGVAVAEPVAFRTAVVATDFSEIGNAIIPYAYAAVERGGTVHLVHVVSAPAPTTPGLPQDIFAGPGEHKDVRARLEALAPDEAPARGRVTAVTVLQGDDVAKTICQASERLGADVVCVASHGRSGLAKAILGSVARDVLRDSRRPVLIIRPPR